LNFTKKKAKHRLHIQETKLFKKQGWKRCWRMCITWPIMSMWCVFIFPLKMVESSLFFKKNHEQRLILPSLLWTCIVVASPSWMMTKFLLLEIGPLHLEDLQFEYLEWATSFKIYQLHMLPTLTLYQSTKTLNLKCIQIFKSSNMISLI
jgi:hypothetical protein